MSQYNLVMSTPLPSNENMKKLILLSTFFFSVSVHALPDCPSDTSVRWNNCLGTYTHTTGEKYVGEWKDSKYHGYGTYTYPNGEKYEGEWKDNKNHGLGIYTWGDGKRLAGYFMNNEYLLNICEDMGLVKGTESFGNCVLKLIDDL